MSFQVSKDDRSDIESSSEEETETTPKERLKTASSRGENGTNGHFGSKPWSQNHNNWWRSLHVALRTKNSCPRNIVTGLFLIPIPHSNTKITLLWDFWDSVTEIGASFRWWWDSNDIMATTRSLWKRKTMKLAIFAFPRVLVLGAEKTKVFSEVMEEDSLQILMVRCTWVSINSCFSFRVHCLFW